MVILRPDGEINSRDEREGLDELRDVLDRNMLCKAEEEDVSVMVRNSSYLKKKQITAYSVSKIETNFRLTIRNIFFNFQFG